MLINLIVAVDSNWGISKGGSIPWTIKEDRNFFLDTTKRTYLTGKKNAIIIGRKTWEALPHRGFKDRITIVISNSITDITEPDVYLVKSISDSIELCRAFDVGKVFICGGSQIYKEAITTLEISEIYLTKINENFNCDNLFPIDNLDLGQYDKYINMFFMIDNIAVNFIKYSNRYLPIVNKEETQYLNLLHTILSKGHFRQTRNSQTWSTFGKTLEFDLGLGFPILTTKKVFFRGVFEELLFFLKGDTNANHLSDAGVKIWEPNTTREFLDMVGLEKYPVGDMGPMYGYQLRNFNAKYQGPDHDYTNQGVDQVAYCLNLLKTDPYNRRILMTTFNPAQVTEGVLWPCHGISILFNVEENHRLSCMMTQRSVDTACGLPFNIVSYALLVHLFCEVINNDPDYSGLKFTPGRLIMNLGDTHIYKDHYSDIIRQVLREPYEFPQLQFNKKVTDLADFKFEDINLVGYQSYPTIGFKMVA